MSAQTLPAATLPATPAGLPDPGPVDDMFATPDDTAPLRASQLHASLGEELGAEALGGLESGTLGLARALTRWGLAHGADPLATARAEAGGVLPDALERADARAMARPDVPIDQARARVRDEGLEPFLTLPAQKQINANVFDLMLQEARERAQYNAAVARGPHGFWPGALGLATSIGVGMIDPLNIAAFSVPVIGEARYGKLLASAGDSMLRRGALRAGVGAAQGAVGGAALAPLDWWLKTQDGQDYTFAAALRSVALTATQGALFHAGGGALGDVFARAAGRPLPGSLADLHARAVAGDTRAAELAEELGGGAEPAQGAPGTGVDITAVPGVSATNEELAPLPGAEAQAPAPGAAPQASSAAAALGEDLRHRLLLDTPHPAQVFADLPPEAREDVVKASVANVIEDKPNNAAEMLAETAKVEPRIAESLRGGGDQSAGAPVAVRLPGAPVRYAVAGRQVAVDAAHDVVSGANSSAAADGAVFVDRRIPRYSPTLVDRDGNAAELWKYLAVHEVTERDGMARAVAAFEREYGHAPDAAARARIYDNVHTYQATPAERAAVEADGVDWTAYTREIDGYLDRIEHERVENAPPGKLHVDPQAAIGHHRGSNKTIAQADAVAPAREAPAREAPAPGAAENAQRPSAPAQSAAPPDWQSLAREPGPPEPAPEVKEAEATAEEAPAPGAGAAEAASAIQREARRAEAMLDAIRPLLSEDERAALEEALTRTGDDETAQAQIAREAATCLIGATGEAA